MIPPNQGSILFQDSSLNKTPRKNFYISGYEVPNEIVQDVIYRAQTVIFVLKFSDIKGKIVTRGSPYKFTILNSPAIRYLGKMSISPTW